MARASTGLALLKSGLTLVRPQPCVPSVQALLHHALPHAVSHRGSTHTPHHGHGFGMQGMGRSYVTSLYDAPVFELAAVGPTSGSGQQGLPMGDQPPLIITPTPVRVVVIGWMGCRKRYLAKYSNLWGRSGDHAVLTIRPSIPQTMFRIQGVVAAGKDIDRVARLHIENAGMPTFYHIFSMGGFIHAGTMWRWMDEVQDMALRRSLLEEVKGIILDSTPAKVTSEVAGRAVVSAVTGVPAELVEQRLPGPVSASRSFFDYFLNREAVKTRTEEVYDAWYNLAPHCPQLYLYSDDDPLVDAQQVEKYMQLQESRGVDVYGYKWVDSGHCEHLRRFPHEYAYQVSNFVSTCLKEW